MITEIRTHRDNCKESLRSFKIAEHPGKFGQEQEYTAQKILENINLILVGVTSLTKKPIKFIQNSTWSERRDLAGWLNELNAHIVSKDLPAIINTLESIKPFLRSIGIYFTNERVEAHEEYIRRLLVNASGLSQHIIKAEAIESKTKEIEQEISESHQQLTEIYGEQLLRIETLGETINSTEREREKLAGIVEQDSARSQEVERILTEAKSHKGVIDGFVQRISQRESQLEDQEEMTREYIEKLEAFKAGHERYNSEADELIKQSKSALELSTSVGLSKAFSAQYDKANKRFPKFFWITTAGILGGLAVYLGWLALDETNSVAAVMGRISLLPILIAGAWFCAGQYVKQKNIAEDYAYKAVLAKSIVGFSDQLSTESQKGDDHSIFMRLALYEMIKNPLRKHPREASSMSELLNKLSGLFKINTPE